MLIGLYDQRHRAKRLIIAFACANSRQARESAPSNAGTGRDDKHAPPGSTSFLTLASPHLRPFNLTAVRVQSVSFSGGEPARFPDTRWTDRVARSRDVRRWPNIVESEEQDPSENGAHGTFTASPHAKNRCRNSTAAEARQRGARLLRDAARFATCRRKTICPGASYTSACAHLSAA